MINRLTADLVWSWHPCSLYSRARIDGIYGVHGLTPLRVCDLPDISAKDKLWTLLREEVLPAATLRLLACRWGATAVDAAQMARWAAAWTVAVAAAQAAGRDAAWTAARGGARETAATTAWQAAEAAAWEAQLADVRNILAEDEHD